MTKKKKKNYIRSLMLFGTISLVVIGYFFYMIFYYTYNIYNLKKEEKTLTEELNTLEVDEKYYRSDIEKLKDSDYIANYARETYLYSKNGEIIIKLEEEKENSVEENNNKYFKYIKYTGIVLIIVFIYIFLKNRKHKKDNRK